jgi:hypothetical protein
MLLRISIVLIVLGCALGFYTYQEGGLAVNASTQAETIALKDLIARGPNGNPHIVLTNFELDENIVCSTKDNSTTWEEVWVPLHPEDDDGQAPGKAPKAVAVQALLFSKHCRNADELRARCGNVEELHGMVINKIKGLGSEEQKQLASHYPGTDFGRCLIFEEGRSPAAWGVLLGLWAGSAALVVLGLLLLVVQFVRRRTV